MFDALRDAPGRAVHRVHSLAWKDPQRGEGVQDREADLFAIGEAAALSALREPT